MMEEFRGFSNLPLQRLTTSKDVVDNPNYLSFGPNLSNISPTPEEDEEDTNEREYEIKEQDRWLPLANVGRVMKNALPPQAKLSKDSKMCIQECVSEFISFITSGAADKCYSENRKTLNGEDVLYAMRTLGFENYAETLKIYLAKYRHHESLDSEERRMKDRVKRQLRKERKEREYLEMEQRMVNDNEELFNAEDSTDTLGLKYSEVHLETDGPKDQFVSESNEEFLENNYTIAPNQIIYDELSDVLDDSMNQTDEF
ncbi:hypothetical protein WICPIJ_006801 [Wickerhamomyces pijperi]|uniref:Transcription factor CBF/NF-Y/archaeal histone domain-containing protein n=1 Tax=Wickerhamomyces pijperi TaxID=599730 RepID=A0A9P8Q134_WICPI|nr:hypothetical protein WICPIJ_006801 [Wickerhamomyces pijperi]